MRMFFTYLRRELRWRIRQAIFIALGLAVGIGLVITVTAASSGVKSAEGSVLKNLYGVGTDATVTKNPTAGSFAAGRPSNFNLKSGSTVKIDPLTATRSLGSLDDSAVTTISKLKGVAAASGALTADSVNTTFKIPKFSSGSGGRAPGGAASGGTGGFSGPGSFNTGNTVPVDGVDLASSAQVLGPLSNGTLKSGRTLKSSDASSDVAVIDPRDAKAASLKVGSDVTIASIKFTVVGIVSVSASDSSADVYIPLARAPALANSLGKWLAIAVLIAAFLLASLLTMSAVSRRVREFGTLKALGWRSRRVIGQVMGESITMGIIGGLVGVGLGFAGAEIVTKVTKPLTASLGPTTGSATPGGARTVGGGGGGGCGGGGGGGSAGRFRGAAAAAHPTTVHLTAPVTVNIIILAVVLAVAGGLIAGMFGGWRAARLRPGAALVPGGCTGGP